MLHHLAELNRFTARGADDKVGSIEDFLFDDHTWTARYVVVDTGGWLSGRSVLLSPAAVDRIDPEKGELQFVLTRQQIESSPPLDADMPVSRGYESQLAQHYGWPQYWSSRAQETAAAGPPPIPSNRAGRPGTVEPSGHNLRSVKDVTGYDLFGLDGRIGRITDFLADDYEWTIRYVVVDTGRWLSGQLVLVSPQWIDSMDWTLSRAETHLTRTQIETSPEYDPNAPVARGYEELLHQHYGREQYWIADKNAPAVRL